MRRSTTALDAREKAAAEKKQAQTRVTTWNERVIEARKSIPDYDAVMAASDVPVAEHVLDELRESELGPQLAYHLDKNPDVAEKLNTMNPRQAAREIGRLEAKLLGTASASPDPKVDAPQEPAGSKSEDHQRTPSSQTCGPRPLYCRRSLESEHGRLRKAARGSRSDLGEVI
jgi:hypothetical protein